MKIFLKKIMPFFVLVSIIWAITISLNRVSIIWSMHQNSNKYARKNYTITSSACDHHASVGKSQGSFYILAKGRVENKEITMDLSPYFEGEINCVRVNDKLKLNFKPGTVLDVLYNSNIEAGYLNGQTPSIIPYQQNFKEQNQNKLIKNILLAFAPLIIFLLPYFFKII